MTRSWSMKIQATGKHKLWIRRENAVCCKDRTRDPLNRCGYQTENSRWKHPIVSADVIWQVQLRMENFLDLKTGPILGVT